MKRILSIVLAGMLALSAAACGAAPAAAPAQAPAAAAEAAAEEKTDSAGPVKIGVVGPLTGESSIYGDVLTQTVIMLAEQTNEAGGVLGGRELQIITYDNRDDIVETTNAAKKAITNDGVTAFIGTDSSASTIALVDIASEYEIPVVTSIATNEKVTKADDGSVRPYAFRACLSDPQSGQILGQYAVEELGYNNIAIIYELGSDFSIGVTQEFSAAVEAAGGTIVCKEAYNTGDVDYRAVLTKIQNSGEFDALYIAAGFHKQIGLIANQARALGFEEPFLTTEGAMSANIFNIGGEAVEDMVFNVAVDTENEAVKPFLDDFIARWDYDPSINVGPDAYLAYDAFRLLVGAIEAAGTDEPHAVRDALEATTDLQGLTSPISFDPATHLVYREVPLFKIEGGEFQQVMLFSPEVTK